MMPPPCIATLSAAVGPDSPAFRQTAATLAAVYQESRQIPPVANSYRAWAAGRPPDAAGADAFVRHTALALLLRLLAYRFLSPRSAERDLRDVILGDWFAGAGWSNFLGEDFFSWPWFRLSMGIGDDAEAMDAARNLLSALQPFDFAAVPPDLPSAVIASEPEFSPTPGNPGAGGLFPDCGPGDALAAAVRAAVPSPEAPNPDPATTLLTLSGQFLAMTPDPLAATAAAVNFLFALGDLAREPHPPILIPVYQADASRIPPVQDGDSGNVASYIIDPPGVTLPARVAADPLYLDWLLGRLPNYQRGAALRLRAQPEAEAIQEVLNAWHNYLTAPKLRTPIPEPLSPADADLMTEAARTLIVAYIRGGGPAPLHYARNVPAPLFAARRTGI